MNLSNSNFLSKEEHTLLNYPSHALSGLLWNIIGLVAIIAWTGVTCFVMFSILAKLKMLRVETEQEFKGKQYMLCTVCPRKKWCTKSSMTYNI